MSCRVVLITRRFWPLVGGAETVMSNLAVELQRQGATVTILTARWEPNWPAEIMHRGVPVIRLPQPRLRFWGTLRYMAAVRRWLQQNSQQWDVAYVSMLKHDAHAAITAARKLGRPVVCRAEGAGLSGDVHWQVQANFGEAIRRRCYQAAALVAPSEAIHRELVAAGYQRQRIVQIPNGVSVTPEAPPATAQRLQARNALAEVTRGLATEPRTPVALYTGRLHEAKGLLDLVAAWPMVLEHFPTARLWLVGEGPQRAALAQRISEMELSGSVVLPGAFDSVDDLLVAADLFVLPSWEEGMSVSLLEAMAAGVPVVASDIPGNRALIQHGAEGLLVPTGDPERLAAAICESWQLPAEAATRAAAARLRVCEQYSVAKMAREHLELFARVLAGKPPASEDWPVS